MVALTLPCTTADAGAPLTTKDVCVKPVPDDTDDAAPDTLDVMTGIADVPPITVEPVSDPVDVCVWCWFGAADTNVPTSIEPFMTEVTAVVVTGVAVALNDAANTNSANFFILLS
jgi:hypothetical protein